MFDYYPTPLYIYKYKQTTKGYETSNYDAIIGIVLLANTIFSELYTIQALIQGIEPKRLKFSHRSKQLYIIDLLYNNKDVILIIKTRFDKTLIFQIIPLLKKCSIVILVYPLDVIEANQYTNTTKLLEAKLFILNRSINTVKNRRNIIKGRYTYILTSLEIIVDNKEFRDRVFKKKAFRNRLSLIAIDEIDIIN